MFSERAWQKFVEENQERTMFPSRKDVSRRMPVRIITGKMLVELRKFWKIMGANVRASMVYRSQAQHVAVVAEQISAMLVSTVPA